MAVWVTSDSLVLISQWDKQEWDIKNGVISEVKLLPFTKKRWEIFHCGRWFFLWLVIVSDCAAHMKFIEGRKKMLLSGSFVKWSVRRAETCFFTFNFVYSVTGSDFNFSDLKYTITCSPRIVPSLSFQIYIFQCKWKTKVSIFVQYYLIIYIGLCSHMHANSLGCILCHKND